MKQVPEENAGLRFGPFELDAQTGDLRKAGHPLRLAPQPAKVLLLLVRRAGQLVTREQLKHELWGADTFVDFEHGLNTCVRQIRAALDDDADHPRYLETIPRRGYRFLVTPEPTGSPALNIADATRAAPTSGRLRWVMVAAAVLMVAGAVGGGLLLRARRAPVLSSRDQILLTDFQNIANDPVFDGTLKRALAVKLEESPFFNVVSEEKIRQTLLYMGQPASTRVSAAVGREICQRENIKAMIAGEIALLGSRYVLTLEAINCRTGDTLARAQAEASRKEDALRALGTATVQIRRRLGESLASLEGFNTPIEEATTPSLEALRAYNLGLGQHYNADDVSAIPFYQRAIELDPDFTMAYAALGTSYGNLRESDLSLKYMRMAFERRNRATERERLYVSGHYYDFVTGEVEESIKTYQLWARTYPKDFVAHTNLGFDYIETGEFAKAIAEIQEAIRVFSKNSLDSANLGFEYLGLNDLPKAMQAFDQSLAANADEIVAHYGAYLIASIQGDRSGMMRQVAWAAAKPAEGVMDYYQGETAAFAGQLKKADRFFRAAAEAEKRHRFKERAANWEAIAALTQAEFGNLQAARGQALTSVAESRGMGVRVVALLALSQAGAEREAEKLAGDLQRQFPADTLLHAVWLPAARAAIEISHGDPARAIEILRAASPYELGINIPPLPHLYAIYIRGQAYLAAHQASEAAAEFQKILDHRGIAGDSPLYSLAQLGLARAFALRGERNQSRKAYETFFMAWREADAGIPILNHAKKEYSALNGRPPMQ